MEEQNGDKKYLQDLALSYVKRFDAISKKRDPIKAAFCFYDVVKTTYGFAKDSCVYDEEKQDIDNSLEVILNIISLSLLAKGWTSSMVQEFNKKVNDLKKID